MMMTDNIIIRAFKSLIIDMVGEILYFPIWWYTQGFLKILIYFLDSIKNTNRNLALGLLLRHLFQPMFGVEDRTGRIISLFMRLLLVFVRLVLFVVLVVFYLAVVIFWVVLPIVVAAGIYFNFTALWRR